MKSRGYLYIEVIIAIAVMALCLQSFLSAASSWSFAKRRLKDLIRQKMDYERRDDSIQAAGFEAQDADVLETAGYYARLVLVKESRWGVDIKREKVIFEKKPEDTR